MSQEDAVPQQDPVPQGDLVPQGDHVPQDDVVEVHSPTSGGRPRPRRGLAVGLVLAVLAAGAGVTAWVATRDDAGGAAVAVDCPATRPDAGTVPDPPTVAAEDGRLVPDLDPTSVLLCRYDAVTLTPVTVASPEGSLTPVTTGIPSLGADPDALARTVEHDGADPEVTALVAALRAVRVDTSSGSACADASGYQPPVALVRLAYDDGVIWVASTGCAQVTDGDVVGVLDLPLLVDATFDGTAVDVLPDGATVDPSPPASGEATDPSPGASVEPVDPVQPSSVATAVTDPFAACGSPTTPSADAFVPFPPTGVRLCHLAVDPTAPGVTTVDRPAAVAVSLATALDTLPALEPDVACTAIGGEVWQLLFTAADGRTASVQVDAGGCGTATNGARLAKADSPLYATLTAAGA